MSSGSVAATTPQLPWSALPPPRRLPRPFLGFDPGAYRFVDVRAQAIAACGRDWRRAKALFSEQVKEAGGASVGARNALLAVYARSGQTFRALELLEPGTTGAHGAGPTAGPPPNDESFNLAISACAATGHWQWAVQLLREMEARGHLPTLAAYRAAIGACGRATPRATGGPWEQALGLLTEMRARGIDPDARSCNHALGACGKSGAWREALSLLRDMEARGPAPDIVSYNTALHACGKRKQWRQALGLLRSMRGMQGIRLEGAGEFKGVKTLRGDAIGAGGAGGGSVGGGTVRPDVVSFGAAISACGRARQWDTAVALLRCMSEFRVLPDAGCFTAAIGACAQRGKWAEALALLEETRTLGLEPDSAAYAAAIGACGKAGKLEEALGLLRAMEVASGGSSGAQPTAQAHSAAARACRSSGRWKEAVALLGTMRTKGTCPNLFAYRAALRACAASGRGREALKLLRDMRGGAHGGVVRPDVACLSATLCAVTEEQEQERGGAIGGAIGGPSEGGDESNEGGGELGSVRGLLAELDEVCTADLKGFKAALAACRRGAIVAGACAGAGASGGGTASAGSASPWRRCLEAVVAAAEPRRSIGLFGYSDDASGGLALAKRVVDEGKWGKCAEVLAELG